MNYGLHKVFICTTAVLILACSVIPGQALDPLRTNSEYARERWGSEKGFPAAAKVSAFAQTPDGYLWIGTDKGVIRFDGVDFRVFQQGIPSSLPIGPVRSLLTDSDGNLWILLQSTEILRYRDGKFEPGRGQAEYGITAMCKRSNGSILFSSLSYGTLTYRNGKFETIASSPEEVSTGSQGETHQPYDDTSARFTPAPDINQRVHSLASAVVAAAENPGGKIWLGTLDSGLFDIADGKVSAVATLSARITSILPLSNKQLWIGTENGVTAWNGVRLTQTDVPSSLRQTRTVAMIQDRDSNIWVSTSQGLVRFNSNGTSTGTQTEAIGVPVTALFEDREGNLWVGGLGSIERWRDSVFITYPARSFQTESGGPILVDDEGRTWFAPFEGGLHSEKNGKEASITKDGLAQDVIYSIAGGKDDLWLGRRRGGVTHLRLADGRIWTKTYTQADGLAQNSVYAVYQDRSGAIWAATVNAGVSKYWKGRFTTYSKAHGMASDTVFSIEESPDGTLWFATPNGLNAFSKGQWRVYTTLDGLPSDNVSCLLSDSSGILWIGTGAGLAYLRSGHIQKVSDTASSLQEEILGIAADHIGNLWIATSNHILSVKRERLLSTTTTKSDLRDYGLEDGLAGTQGIKRFRSVVTDAQGRIWFSTSRGLSVVDPSRAGREPPYVTVQIEGFSADGNSLNLQPPIRVPPDTHRLSFSYSGLSLSTPERIQFKYKLDGFDNDWSEPVSTRAAVYTNVGWGAYTFRVMASNSAGAWNTQSVALPFSIAPTWYQTRTYRVLLAASLLLGGWALYRWRVHQLTVQERRMRDVVDTIPAMTFTTSPDGSSTFVNKGWIEYTGLSVEQTSGAGWQRAIHPDDLARHSEKWRISVTTGQLFEDEARFRRSADGKYRWFLVRGVPLRDQHKKIVKWYGTLTDIEDRRRAEEGLQRSQFYINEGQRLAQMGSWAFNPLGFFDYWSDELFQIYGLDSKKGAPTLDQYLATLHPQDRDSMAETIKTMHIERCGCDVKKRIVRPDGQLRYVRCVGIPVVEGEVLRGFLGTAIDITDQELLTRELEHQRAYLTEAQKLTHTGSWVWRVSDRFAIHLSEEWYRIYDFNLAEGPPPWEKRLERVYLEDRLKWKGAIERALAEKTDYDVEFRILLPSGTVKWIHTVGHPVFSDAGELVQFVGISTDITERKSAEWERERLHQLENDLAHINRVSMLGEMAASLAHEIKQPIAAAITSANSCIEWLAHDPPNLDRARAAVARIDKYGNRAAQIIDHIRSFYKQAPSQYELVDANGIVEEIFTLLQDDAIRYSITMRPELAAQMPRIIADRVQLQQVFMNLMLNAIEAMHTSGGELTVRSQSKDGQLLFSVSDTGLGLPTENVDQIYSPFYTTKQQGSGMGLAISRTIVESYGGRLWATANNGRGATFHFTLPAEAKDSSPSST